MQDKEKELLFTKQQKDLAERQGYFNYMVSVLVSLCLILLIVFSIYVTISLRKARKQKIEIELLNTHLERIVEQRTVKLNERNRQLERYAFLNAHRLRSPVAAILGLCNLLKLSNSESEWKEVLPRLDNSVHELDKIVFEIQRMVDENPVLE
jgi:signal transduction histidine kinase